MRISLSSWHSVLRHPRAAVLLLDFMPMSLMMRAYEHWAHYLAINGIPSRLHLLILDSTDELTFGSILFTAQRRMDGGSDIRGLHNDRLPFLSQASAALPISEKEMFASSIGNYVRGVLVQDGEVAGTPRARSLKAARTAGCTKDPLIN